MCIVHNMEYDDRPEAAIRLEEARRSKGFATAKQAADYYGWNYDTYAQHENGTRGIIRAAGQYAKAYGVEEGWLLAGTGRGPVEGVPLKGYVGAGQVVQAIDNGTEERIEAPAARRPTTVAAIVRGDSMMPTFQDGWTIYWSQQLPPQELVNQLCVVQLENDDIYVKVLRRGSKAGLWTLSSINATVRDLEDQVVRWAAPIDWIRPR